MMRITNGMTLRHYHRSLNKLANLKSNSMLKIESGREYFRASESPVKAAKALTIRKQIYDTEQFKENLEVADKFYTEAESSLLRISDTLAGVRELIISGVSTAKDEAVDIQIIAQQLETKAQEMCTVFNTDTAERVIFGGESNNPEPFTIKNNEMLYHGVPIDAYSDPKSFPFSNDVYIDIGVGIQVDQETQEIDPQSALKISFNGAQITGCGVDGGVSDIDLSSIENDKLYSIDVMVGNVRKTVEFGGKDSYEDNVKAIRDAMDYEFQSEKIKPVIDERGVISADGAAVLIMNNPACKRSEKLSYTNVNGYSDRHRVKLDELVENQKYNMKVKVGDEEHLIEFTAGNDSAASRANIQNELNKITVEGQNPYIDKDGYITMEGQTVKLTGAADNDEVKSAPTDNFKSYSNNYIQLTLDAAKAFRDGDLEYANGCIDRIVTATENILVQVTDLGNSEDYIEYMQDRYDTRILNLDERQKEIEGCDEKMEITLMKQYEALYNACLQMSSQVIPNSIFNYIS